MVKKSNKIIIIASIVVIVIIAIIIIIGMLFLITDVFKSPEQLFYKYHCSNYLKFLKIQDNSPLPPSKEEHP